MKLRKQNILVFLAVIILVALVVLGTVAFQGSRRLEVTESQWDDLGGKTAAELECVAEPYTRPLFKRDGDLLTSLHIKQGAQVREEIGVLRESNVEVTVNAGGCSHYGFSFRFSFARNDQAKQTDQSYVDKAFAHLKKLPLSDDVDGGGRSTILSLAKTNEFQIPEDGDCRFVETPGYSWAYCGVERRDDRVVVNLSYTIAL